MSLRFPQRLQAGQAREVLDALTRQLQPGRQQPVSLADLDTFDSSALAVMLALKRQAQAHSADLQWQDVPPRMLALANLYGVSQLLAMGES